MFADTSLVSGTQIDPQKIQNFEKKKIPTGLGTRDHLSPCSAYFVSRALRVVSASSAVLTEWYIRSGVAGIFSICLSSEMFQV